MKRLLLSVALVAISLLCLTLLFVEQTRTIHASSQTTLVVYEHATTSKTFGDTKNINGSYNTYTDPVYDVSDKIRIGSADGFCLFVSKAVEQCDWTVVLPAGKIILSSADAAQDVTVTDAVVGGTGAYNAAKGEAVLTFSHTQKLDEYKYTFNLS